MKKVIILAIMLSAAVTAVAQESFSKYEIKSGKLKAVTEVMGQKVESTGVFDHYGAWEATKTKTSIPGVGDMEVATITKDGKSYMVNYTARQVQEMPVQESINYLAISKEAIMKYNLKEAGTEMIGDKECVKYTAEVSQMGQTATVTSWVWKGYAIKSVTSVAGMSMTAEVVEFIENAEIDPKEFEVPSF